MIDKKAARNLRLEASVNCSVISKETIPALLNLGAGGGSPLYSAKADGGGWIESSSISRSDISVRSTLVSELFGCY